LTPPIIAIVVVAEGFSLPILIWRLEGLRYIENKHNTQLVVEMFSIILVLSKDGVIGKRLLCCHTRTLLSGIHIE